VKVLLSEGSGVQQVGGEGGKIGPMLFLRLVFCWWTHPLPLPIFEPQSVKPEALAEGKPVLFEMNFCMTCPNATCIVTSKLRNDCTHLTHCSLLVALLDRQGHTGMLIG